MGSTALLFLLSLCLVCLSSISTLISGESNNKDPVDDIKISDKWRWMLFNPIFVLLRTILIPDL